MVEHDVTLGMLWVSKNNGNFVRSWCIEVTAVLSCRTHVCIYGDSDICLRSILQGELEAGDIALVSVME